MGVNFAIRNRPLLAQHRHKCEEKVTRIAGCGLWPRAEKQILYTNCYLSFELVCWPITISSSSLSPPKPLALLNGDTVQLSKHVIYDRGQTRIGAFEGTVRYPPAVPNTLTPKSASFRVIIRFLCVPPSFPRSPHPLAK